MNEKLESLLARMQTLEKEILRELQKKELEFFYEVRQGKIRFTEEAHARHKLLVKRFASYIRDSRFMILLTTPVIWACFIPIALLDVFMIVYQAICFPVLIQATRNDPEMGGFGRIGMTRSVALGWRSQAE
jgi:hypothetical protein